MDHLDPVVQWLGPVFVWLYAIGGSALVLGGITCIWSWANQLFNFRFKKERYENKLADIRTANKQNPRKEEREPKTPRWRLARAQQIGVLRYGYPWGLLLLAAMGYLVHSGFDTTFYVAFTACWFVLRHVRYSHKVRRIVKLNAKIHQDGFVPGHKLLQRSAREYIEHHYSWGFSEPSFVGNYKKPQRRSFWYYGPAVLRVPVNWICNLVMTILKFGWLRKLFHLRAIAPLICYGTIDLFWPLTGPIAVLINTSDIMEKDHDRSELDTEPWWSFGSPRPPYARQIQINVLDDTDGDNVPRDTTEVVIPTDTGYIYGSGNSDTKYGVQNG
jgi:hypothetical protein